MMRAAVFALAAALLLPAQQQQAPKSYLVKLSTPVSSKTSKAGDKIRAAVISPESLLNGYLEGTVEKAVTKPRGTLVLRFDKLVYKGNVTALATVVIDWVNSKGHKALDDNERAATVEKGELRSAAIGELWLDEGAEIRIARLQ